MGTRQSRSGHQRQGTSQQGQQRDQRPQQDRDLQRNQQSDRGQQQQQQGDRARQQAQGGSAQPQHVHGEGNYAATRQYDDATKQYAKSGRVEQAARAAAPKSQADAREMDSAEAEGRRHAKGEDPALERRTPPSGTPRPGHEEE